MTTEQPEVLRKRSGLPRTALAALMVVLQAALAFTVFVMVVLACHGGLWNLLPTLDATDKWYLFSADVSTRDLTFLAMRTIVFGPIAVLAGVASALVAPRLGRWRVLIPIIALVLAYVKMTGLAHVTMSGDAMLRAVSFLCAAPGAVLAAYVGTLIVPGAERASREDVTPPEDDTPTARAKASPAVLLIALVALVGIGTCAGVSCVSKTGQETSALHEAVEQGDLARVRELLESGAAVDARDADGQTPLMVASRDGHVEIARLLMESGADVTATSSLGFALRVAARASGSAGYTPLHWAASAGETALVKELLEAGADPDAKGVARTTPLHWAAKKGRSDVVKVLLEAGANCDAADLAGMTALHHAAIEGYPEVAAVLLAAGADASARSSIDEDTKTPLEWALATDHADVAEVLQRHAEDAGEQTE